MKKFLQNLTLVLLAAIVCGLVFAFAYDTLQKQRVLNVVATNEVKETFEPEILKTEEEKRIELVEQVKDSVVNIYLERYLMDRSLQYVGGGSGVVYAEDEQYFYIITNYHVASGGDIISITIDDNPIEVEMAGGDGDVDLAVLKLKKSDVPSGNKIHVASLGDSQHLQAGESVIAVGNALGFGQSTTQGIISAINRNIDKSVEFAYSLIQTDAAINPGNSGGALINTKGEVIGINTLKIADTQVEGIGFAIPINQAKEIADTIRNEGFLPKAYLGVSVRNLDLTSLESAGYPKGVLVVQVSPNSPADKAGIKKGDLILNIGDKETYTGDQMRNAIWLHQVGDTVSVELYRNNRTLQVDVILEQSKQ